MQFLILGPLEVSDGGRKLALGGPKQRAVLAHLILRANRVVPADLLIDGLWGEEPPESARNTLQTYVYRLRKVLGDGRLEGRDGGYVLTATPGEIDAERFEALVKQGRAEVATDPGAAAATLSDALSLWRADALADVTEEPSLRGEAARLEELRLSATEHRVAAQIAMGGHSAVVPELESLTARYPLRERLWANLMLALYRSGRQAEALSTFERARQVLADELGADPSPELQRLHDQILHRAPELESPAPGAQAHEGPSIETTRVDLQPGTGFAGYRIEGVLGRGGMSVVYLADHERLQRKVALKVLAPQLAQDERFRERFERESRLAAAIEHPNVIPIYEAGGSAGELFIAMRYVEGTDLRSVLQEGPLDAARAITIVQQIGAALDAAHEQGLVHRDVKPGNVLLARKRASEPGEHVYLSDFGLTKRSASDSGITGTGQFVGTLDYAAPEQFEGGTPDARTDVYSLGCVLFECLTGSPPFSSESDAGLMYAHLQQPPPSVSSERPDLPPGVDRVIAKAMAKAPIDRYPTAGELAQDAAAELGEPIGGRARPPGRIRRRRIGAIAAALAVLAVVGTLLAIRSKEGSPPRNGRSDGSGTAAAVVLDVRRAVAAIDPRDGTILDAVGSLDLETFDGSVRPELAAGVDAVWVIDGFKLIKLDPASGSMEQLSLNGAGGRGFVPMVATGSGLVVITNATVGGVPADVPTGSISRITKTNQEMGGSYESTGGATDIAVGAGTVWATFDARTLLSIDPRTLLERQRWQLSGGLDAVAVGRGSVWVGDREGARIWRVDPRTGIPTGPFELDGGMDGIAALGGTAWVLDREGGTVTPVAPSGAGASISVGTTATDIAAGLGAMWISGSDGSLRRVDPQTHQTRKIEVGYPIEALTFDPGREVVWVLVVECPSAGIPESATQGGVECH
jgi:DNA-binding SARP family transcriptional activator